MAHRPADAGSQNALRRDAALVAAGQLAAIASAFLLTIAGARLLPPEDFGALSWALSWLTFLAVLAQFGLTQVATIALARGDARRHTGLLRRLLVAQAVGVAVVGALWWGGAGPLAAGSGSPPAAYRPLVMLVAAWLPVAAVGPVLVNAFRARGSFGLSLIFGEHVRRVLLIGLIVVLAAGAGAVASLETALWWAVALESAVYLAGILLLFGVVRSREAAESGSSPWQLLRSGGPFTLATLASVTVPQAGIWLLAALAPVDEVAVFSVAVRIAVLFAVPVSIGMRTLAPRIAAASASGRLPDLAEPIRRSAVWSTAVTAPAVLALAVAGPLLVPAVFGADYAAALVPALVMSAGVLVNAWTGPCSVVLSHAGRQRLVAVSALVSSGAFFALGVWWGSTGGALGVAAAAAVAMSARNLHLAWAAARTLGIRTIALPARKGLPS
ncbi:lipopolysaccharide biosynthesis protein [Geodermatophilus ruber]|uniref:Membrane protein involved in the export of O-antigen and teichoic acid n=1 Tax=Geodermatophilus ruber TaxID=504800 RepID=A0A1I4BPN8_9ACTN|nr:lipopolysaccharide biosynthesis protein [Geodermatophilus ruber]SFK70798.1 Membrane protein involved in the export of O-antigen and teichoic acid [Geodermatophilus ruber]